MAIRFGMTIAEMIAQLTRGFRSVAGRDPDGLEKIKIQQEAVQRFKDMNKVVDMQGRTLDPSKTIMGGTQEGAALRSGIMKATGAKPKKIDPDKKAEGGRIGYKDGPDQPGRRKFIKIMGGLAALPIIGKFFKAGKVVAPAAQAIKKTVQQAPSYFFDLAEKIKILGRESKVSPRERVREIDYKNYTLQEDVATGDMTIIKRKGDPEFAYEEEVMTLRKGQADEMTQGRTPPDEYEELTVRPDPEGKMKDVEDGIEPESIQEIVDEISEGGGNLDQQTLEEIARGKLASGGIASMLGE